MVYTFLADGFEEIEAIAAIDVMRRGGLEVITVGVGTRQLVGAHGIPVMADIAEEEVCLSDALEAAVLPGGMPGTLNLEKSAVVQRTVDFCAERHKIVGAICAAPSILGHKGLLKGRSAVCFPGFEQELEGALLTAGPVCADDNFVTAKGAGVAVDFGLKIVELFRGKDTAEQLKAGMQCK